MRRRGEKKGSERARKPLKSDDKFLRVSSLRDRKKSTKDLAQHLAAGLTLLQSKKP